VICFDDKALALDLSRSDNEAAEAKLGSVTP